MKFTPYDRTPRERAIETKTIGNDEDDLLTTNDIRYIQRTNRYGR
jgi:hypothetical protein